MKRLCFFCVVGIVSSVGASRASARSKWESKGQLALESRFFSFDGDDGTKDAGVGLFGRLELEHKHRPFQQRARVYGRLDQQDAGRTVFVVEELWSEYKAGDFKIRVGADLLNWTATEAFHPADIINARNLDSDAENYEKVGEPMVSASYKLGRGRLTAYFFPYYSRPILPSASSRLSFVPPDADLGSFLRMDASGDLVDRDFGPQGALRLTQSLGPAELGLHVVHHLDRQQPEILVDADTGQARALFRTVTQIGGTYQHVWDALIAKVELGYRIFAKPGGGITEFGPVQDRDHLRAAVGFEYGWVHEGGAESMLLLEAQSIFFVSTAVRRALEIFQRDVLLGYRITMNDAASSELLVSAIVDAERPEDVFFNLSFTRRIWEDWSASAAARMVFGAERNGGAGIAVPLRSDHVRLFLTRYF